MNAAIRTTKPGKQSAPVPQGAATPRISAKMRRVIDLVAIEGLTQKAAAERVGIHPVNVSKYLAKPHIRALFDERKAQSALEAERLKGIARSLAIQEGIRLMTQASSEAVRAKMVEFFAGEARQAAVNVQINNAAPMGYAYRRPDSPSSAIEGQAVEIKGDGPAVE